MEPPQIAVEVPDGDAAPPAQEAPDLAAAAVDRLDVWSVADPIAGRGVDALVRGAERHRDGRIAAVDVGDQRDIQGEGRLQHRLHVVCVQRRQGVADEGRTGSSVGGDQDRHLLAREAAFLRFAGAACNPASAAPCGHRGRRSRPPRRSQAGPAPA